VLLFGRPHRELTVRVARDNQQVQPDRNITILGDEDEFSHRLWRHHSPQADCATDMLSSKQYRINNQSINQHRTMSTCNIDS
jgi:hypothetical protein